MKRYMALAMAICLALLGSMVVQAEGIVKNDPAGLVSHQAELDKIRSNITYAETAGYHAMNVKSLESQGAENAQDQVSEDGGVITIHGGLHYMDGQDAIDQIILENDAVLINFGVPVNMVTLRGTSQYYFTATSGTQGSVILTDESFAYLQNATGQAIQASGRSEVLLLGGIQYDTLQMDDASSVAVLGNVSIAASHQASTGRIFDPNQMLPMSTEKAEVEPEKPRSGGSGKSSRPKNDTPYPDHINEWVFMSKPQESAQGAGPCNCCGCASCTGTQLPCCSKCSCIFIKDEPLYPIQGDCCP